MLFMMKVKLIAFFVHLHQVIIAMNTEPNWRFYINRSGTQSTVFNAIFDIFWLSYIIRLNNFQIT